MPRWLDDVWQNRARLFFLILPLAYYFKGRFISLVLNIIILFALILITCLKNYSRINPVREPHSFLTWRAAFKSLHHRLKSVVFSNGIKIKPEYLNNFFAPETKSMFLALACLFSMIFYRKLIAVDIMLFIILGNTFAGLAKPYYGRLGELLVFAWVCLSASLFILFFPILADWRIALFGCFAAVTVKWVRLAVNEDISVALASGIVMSLFLNRISF